MPRTVKTITFSLPPELMKEVDRLTRIECRTRSELLREALRRYIEDRELKQALKAGQRPVTEVVEGAPEREPNTASYQSPEGSLSA